MHLKVADLERALDFYCGVLAAGTDLQGVPAMRTDPLNVAELLRSAAE